MARRIQRTSHTLEETLGLEELADAIQLVLAAREALTDLTKATMFINYRMKKKLTCPNMFAEQRENKQTQRFATA